MQPEALQPNPNVHLGFAAMCLGMFMAILDIQIVATSLPTIQASLAIAPDAASWMQTAYLIAEIVAIPLTGTFTHRFGLRRLFSGAVLIFTLASIGCAASDGFAELVLWRVVQGFAGGVLIPSVFAAVFLLFPVRQQGLATTIAGVLAVLAPTVGPIVGGWITGTYSWHWLFLINVAPGLLSTIGGLAFLSRAIGDGGPRPSFDLVSVVLLATGLAALVIALKEAPHRGWASPVVLLLLAWALACLCGLIAWSERAARPLLDLALFRDRDFAIGCALSFVLGIGLFGCVYLMPVFLAYVRGHDALEIGRIMLSTGIAQLVSAPIAVWLEPRTDPRHLSAFGFSLLALGLWLSTAQTLQTDESAMLVPQIVRGAAFMFCLLPPTRLALGRLPDSRIPDASGLFNLMRNLGGAIGIALIDTVIYGQAPGRGAQIAERLRQGDAEIAGRLDLPSFLGAEHPLLSIGPRALQSLLEPRIARLALVETINVAWWIVAILTAAALLALPFAGRPAGPDAPGDPVQADAPDPAR